MKYKMEAKVSVRLTRQPGPGVYLPWNAKTGFIWKEIEPLKVEAETIEHLTYLTRHHADKLHRTWPVDELEAVKVEGGLTIDWTDITICTYDDRRETT